MESLICLQPRGYNILDKEKSEIRLLEISPATNEKAIVEIRLIQRSLDKAPKYAALSYVWGDPSATENILMDGKLTAITKSLASALRQLRSGILPTSQEKKSPRKASVISLGRRNMYRPE